jgi:hypothetical protein
MGAEEEHFLRVAQSEIRKFTLNVELSEDSFTKLSLDELDLRIATNLIKGSKIFSFMGEKYNYIFSRYYRILPLKIKPLFIRFVHLIPKDINEETLIKLLKDVGTVFTRMRLNDNYPIWYDYFEELHILSGYSTQLHKEADVLELCQPFLEERKLENPIYRKLFISNIIKTIDLISFKSTKSEFDDWVKFRDNWEIMGSCDFGQALKIKTEGFKTNSRINSKFTNLLFYTDDELLKELYAPKGHMIRPFLKDNEPAKIRIVLAYDTRSYIRCSYLYDFIENLNGLGDWTTVGFNPSQMWKCRNDINDIILKQDKKLVCTDQSAFDQHVYKEFFIIAFNYLCRKIVDLNPQARKIWDLEQYGLENAYFLIDNQKYAWNNGLCSGHKFTALLGSIINRASTLTANDIARYNYPNLCHKMYGGYFQGDDAIVFTKKNFDVASFLEGYELLGLKVNPMKTWVNTTRTEYLHQSYYNNSVVSLPARGTLSLIFGDPQSRDAPIDDKITNYVSNLSQASRRGLDTVNVAHNLMRKVGLTNKESYCYLHTPTCYGGGGFTPYVSMDKMLKLKVKKSMKYKPKSEIISEYHYSIPGIDMKDFILNRVYAHLPAPGIKTTVSTSKVEFDSDPYNFQIIPKLTRTPISYDPMLADNTENWLNHVREQLGIISLVEGIDYADYSSVRRIADKSINLISSASNAFLPTAWSRSYLNDVSTAEDSCLKKVLTKGRFKKIINSMKKYYLKLFFNSSSSIKDYLFAF